jgi:hypothetical protein
VSFTCTTLATYVGSELQQARAQLLDFGAELVVRGAVSAGHCSHNDVYGRCRRRGDEAYTPQLSQAPLQSVALD